MTEMIDPIVPDAQYKDEHPCNTVSRIRKILADHGIEVEESWNQSGVPYCFSCRINVKGTTFGTNGKGLTREFAQASGYGELMERLQLGLIGGGRLQKSGQQIDRNELVQKVDARLLLQEQRGWYDALAEELERLFGIRMNAEKILMQYADADGQISVGSYFNLTRNREEYYPLRICAAVCGSNGGAAGNTMEEAIVQAISETVERNHQIRIAQEQMPLPNIPEEVLQSFDYAYRIITYLRENGIRVFIKDCSLGGKFPVVCACYVDTRTGRYHSHVGAAPVLQIAIERALTETFQGRNLEGFARGEDFDQRTDGKVSIAGIYRVFRVGESTRPLSFFIGEPETSWNSQMGFTGQNNREMLREVLAYFADLGYEVLVRDASCFGFPTCHVLIPGYSEVIPFSLSPKHNIFRFAPHATKTVKNPSQAKLEDYIGLLCHLQEKEQNLAVDGPRVISGLRLAIDVSLDEDRYIMAATLGYVNYELGRRKDALECVTKMVPLAPKEDREALICLKRYLAMQQDGYDGETVKKALGFFHKPETVQVLYGILERKENPLDRYTLHCGSIPCENCQMYAKCREKETKRLFALRREGQKKMDHEAFISHLQACIAEA